MTYTIREGNWNAQGRRFGIVVARFNSFITDKLLEGALEALRRAGAADAISRWHACLDPGSCQCGQGVAQSGKVHAVICLGAVIRGETPHFDYVAGQAASGLAAVQTETGVPVAFGVITTTLWNRRLTALVLRAATKVSMRR